MANKTELQSILGKLIWVSKAIKYSRVFVSRVINEIKLLKSQKQKLTLSPEIRKDFLWWRQYMTEFNGVHLLILNEVSVQIAGDACPNGMWNMDDPRRARKWVIHFPHGQWKAASRM